MRYITGGTIAFVLALVQASSIEQFKIVGATPNLLLVMLATWLVVRGLDDVLPMIAVAGVTTGLIGLQTPGLVLLALLPIAGFGVLREIHVIHNDLVLAIGLVFAASVAYEVVILLSVMATGGAIDPLAALRSAVLPVAIVNVAMTPFVFAVMRLARPPSRGRRLAY